MRPTNFTQFSNFTGITRANGATFSEIAADALNLIFSNYDGQLAYRKWAIHAMYTLAYHIEKKDSVDYSDLTIEKLKQVPLVDEDEIKECFKSNFIPFKDIVWDIDFDDAQPVDIKSASSSSKPEVKTIPAELLQSASQPKQSARPPSTDFAFSKTINTYQAETVLNPTDKSDLYLAPPQYPRFDSSSVKVMQLAEYGRKSIMYESLPKIPRKQNEISITTDVNAMIDSDLLNLFPNVMIQTRKPPMYVEIPKVKYYEDVGTVLPIKGFTEKQLLENVIKYPHLYKLKREVNGKLVPFHHHIEIEGELHEVTEVWDSLPISKLVPKTSEYVLEYVTRRYLLERDIRKMEHKYPIVGSLDPFLTLFGTKEFYLRHGFKDLVGIARQCVESRVNYRKSRNGVFANSGVERCIYAPFCIEQDCKIVCPTYQQIDYLLDQNGLLPPDTFYSAPEEVYGVCHSILSNNAGKFKVIETDKKNLGQFINENPNDFIKVLTYAAICNNWRGSKYSMVAYKLNFAKYTQRIRDSWKMVSEPEDLQYMKIWANSAKVLIISNVDYVSYGDVECQSLLQLVQDREEQHKTTIVVCKKVGNLVGKSQFFNVFIDVLKGGAKTE